MMIYFRLFIECITNDDDDEKNKKYVYGHNMYVYKLILGLY